MGSARRLKLGAVAILAAAVLGSSASAQASSERTPGLLDRAVLTATTVAKATGALEAIEGSLVYLGAK
jgi:hypothetical protein